MNRTAQELSCKSCGRTFLFRECDKVYLKKGFSVPDLCPLCRKERAEQKQREAERISNEEWRLMKAAEKEEFENQLCKWNVIPIESISPKSNKV